MKTYLCEFIEKKCEEAGFFMSQLADKANLSESVIQAIRGGRTQLKPGTKQKLAAALKCSIGDIQDAIRRSDEVLENGEVVRKEVPKEPTPEKDPEPRCPYDEPVEPAAGHERGMPEKTRQKTCILGKVVPMDDSAMVKEPKEDGPDILSNELVAMLPMPKKDDNVNHPAHYTQGGIECIDALRASMSQDEYRGFLKGNVMKYLWRYQHKNGYEDLQKARWYLDKLISEVNR